ncbi:MAG: ABC transporter permease [Rhodothermaceae bacterium]
MYKNHFKIVIRNIIKHKTFSFINIFGLSLGIACAFLIMLWVNDELSYDKFNENYENIYRVVGDWEKNEWNGFEGTPFPIADVTKQNFSDVKNSCRLYNQNRKVFTVNNKSFYEDKGIMADKSFFEIFSFSFLYGEINSAFQNKDGIIISEKLSQKYFGTSDSRGKEILIENKTYFVSAVMQNVPEHSHIQFDYINPMKYKNIISDGGSSWGAFNYITFLYMNDEADIIKTGKDITASAFNNGSAQVRGGVKFRLQPLSEIYLDGRNYTRSYIKLGDKKYIYIFTTIAVFVLLIACINFMNLSTARVSSRLKEIGLRKTIGADRLNLIKQFYGESIITSVISGVISLIIIASTISEFNYLTGKKLSFNFPNFNLVITFCITILLTGIISGTYPAFYLSAFTPVKILKGFTKSSGSKFRKTLVIIQFSMATILLVCTGVMYQQFDYIQNKKLGINTENLLYIPLKENVAEKYSVVKDKMLESSLISNVTGHWNNFINTNWRNSIPVNINNELKSVDIIQSVVDFDFFETLNISLVEGRFFDKKIPSDLNQKIIVNETFLQSTQIKNPIGELIKIRNLSYQIIGVVKDINYQSLKSEIGNRVYFVEKLNPYNYGGIMILKIDGKQTKTAVNYIKDIWNEFNINSPFEYNFINQEYESLYETEYKSSSVINLFTLFTMIVSSLGLFGLAMFIAEKNKKEIGIRKILGSSINKIVFKLTNQFMIWVLISNLFAWPAAYYISQKILDSYVYKTEINFLIFIAAGLITLLTAFLTVGIQAYKASQTNPIEILRNE